MVMRPLGGSVLVAEQRHRQGHAEAEQLLRVALARLAHLDQRSRLRSLHTPTDAGGVSDARARHMLLQYDCRFAHCLNFLFVLANQKQRHSVNRAVGARVKHDARAFAAFSELVADPAFKAKLDAAIQDPKGCEAD